MATVVVLGLVSISNSQRPRAGVSRQLCLYPVEATADVSRHCWSIASFPGVTLVVHVLSEEFSRLAKCLKCRVRRIHKLCGSTVISSSFSFSFSFSPGRLLACALDLSGLRLEYALYYVESDPA